MADQSLLTFSSPSPWFGIAISTVGESAAKHVFQVPPNWTNLTMDICKIAKHKTVPNCEGNLKNYRSVAYKAAEINEGRIQYF